MQDKNKMHPDDLRNLIIFGVLSVLLWLSYDHFILKPKLEQMRVASEVGQKAALEMQQREGMLDEVERPRNEIIAETKAGRVEIDSPLVFGSISLKGARLDDLGLKTYFETVEKDEPVHVLSPAASPYPKYVEHGWVAKDKNVRTPNKESVWSLVGGSKLTPEESIRLQWDNGQGLLFEQIISLNEDYGFTTVQKVINNSGNDVTLYPYSLVNRRGIPKDFQGRWVIHEGPIGYFNKELVEAAFNKMDKEPEITGEATGGWIGLTSKNWVTAIVPEQENKTKFRIVYTKAAIDGIKDRYQADILGPAELVKAESMSEYTTNVFSGPKKLSLLEKYENEWNVPHFDLAVDFGLFYFLTRPFFAIIHFFYTLVGNFGVAIIMFTVMLRICVFPLANTSFKSFARMKKITPQMDKLRGKYRDDKEKLQKEIVKLYQKEKVNPMAGCLPILVQIPIFFSLYKVLSNTIEMRHAPFFGWIQDLSAPDPTSVFNLFGLIPWEPPAALHIGVWPCLMLITMILQRKLSPPPADKFQARVVAFLPWMMTYILSQFASGLVIYWTFSNLLSVIQQYIIMRRMGVEVDLIGNILGRNKEVTPIDGVHPESAMIEEQVEEALGIDQEDTPENDLKRTTKKTSQKTSKKAAKKSVSKPKPKKKNPTQKKKK